MEVGDSNEDGSMQKKFSMQACNVLAELRRTGDFCDAVIKVQSKRFPVHRNILSACSPYFRALFKNQEGNNKRIEVTIPGVSPGIMNELIEYAYTRDIKIHPENVEELLPAAEQFHVTGLVKACCDFLTDQLAPENCIGIRAFAKAYFCHTLERTALKYILKNFCSLHQYSNEFLQLNVDEVSEILSCDNLNVKNEELVFDAVLRWIDYDPERRRCHIAKILKTIRLGLLTTQYFVEKVKSHPYVKESSACKPIIIETLKFLYDLDMDEEKEVDLNHPLAKPRVPHEVLFVIGGWSGGSPTTMVETYDTRADRWIVCKTVDKEARAYHGTVAYDMRIYVIGGFDGVEYFNSVRCFNPLTKIWSEVSPMNCKRCYVSVAVLEPYIYAMGGYNGHDRQYSAERYSKQRNQWSLIQSMNIPRSDASATDLEGKIYICGGFNGQECLNSAEYYDPETNQWTLLRPMRNKRSGVGVIAYRGHLYALGGFNGVSRMNTGERFSLVTNSWQTIPEMDNSRSNFAIEIIDDMIFAIGGFNGVTTIFNVECYDSVTDEWYHATDMTVYRSALSACVIRGLPNIEDFIQQGRE
ncbi:hypothetical protein LOTGIDRAFT_175448 [Lottia gigantea]|uniref:BTB domain-containing protein n=1 Tax=Lottia gigantea TaxID=225164 RepID=V4BZ38_LOTGI|nr:hypothetical protein LOTGIDRAFT_175448 [Lottia gigantea]ESO94394.1 hypothetical protein LOTGIDRAFT_175448 [Lottia gigantea]